MNKRGQGMPGGKSTFIPKFVGFLLILSSLSLLITLITSIYFKIGLLVLGVILFIFSSKTKKLILPDPKKGIMGQNAKSSNRAGQLIAIIIILAGFLLIWFSDFLAPVTQLSDFLSESSIYPFLLLICSVLLFIFGGGVHKILGIILFLISLVNISEFLIDFNNIFSFLSFLSKYGEGIRNSVTFYIIIFVIGIVCFLVGGKTWELTKKGYGVGKGYYTGVKNKEVYSAEEQAYAESKQRDAEKAMKKAQYLANEELDNLARAINRETNPNKKSNMMREYDQKLSGFRSQGLPMNGYKFWGT